MFHFLKRDGVHWVRDGPFEEPIPFERFSMGFSTPTYEKIGRYLRRFGYDSFDHDLRAGLKSKYDPYKNKIDHIVDTRHKIAHGDPDANKSPREVEEAVQTFREFCSTLDAGFATWCRGNLCAIR